MNAAVILTLVVSGLLIPTQANVALRMPTYSLEAVSINDHPLPGGPSARVEVMPGDVVRAELYIRDWSPFGEQLSGAQAQLDAASYYSGRKGTVAPLHFQERMDADQDNPEAFFIDVTHPKYIHKGKQVLPITDTRSVEGYRWLSIQIRPPGPLSEQNGEKFYVGTVLLKVSDNAEGIFRIRLRFEGEGTILIQDSGAPVEPVDAEILVLDVVPAIESGEVEDTIDQLNRSDAATRISQSSVSLARLLERRSMTLARDASSQSAQ
ncbi:MAG: hypothetical protein J5J06_18555 [Phycisphaerae bacterium]|nr:hypothetical protein [Phycisphaerae bacterium]